MSLCEFDAFETGTSGVQYPHTIAKQKVCKITSFGITCYNNSAKAWQSQAASIRIDIHNASRTYTM